MPLEKELELDMPFKDLLHEALLNIVRTADVIERIGDTFFRQFDLTEAQFNLIFSLKYSRRPVTQSDLGKRLVVTRASITSVLDRMESKGLVERAAVPNNRRSYHVRLTEKGRDLLERVEPLYRAEIHGVMATLSERECRSLMDCMERVRERARILANGGGR